MTANLNRKPNTEALEAIKNVAENDSWFRGTPHRWASTLLE